MFIDSVSPSLSVCVLLADLDDPVVTVHQSIGEAKEQFYYERTVFLRCVANSNPPVRYSWHRGREVLTQGSDKGVEIYEPFFTQVRQRQHDMNKIHLTPCRLIYDLMHFFSFWLLRKHTSFTLPLQTTEKEQTAT